MVRFWRLGPESPAMRDRASAAEPMLGQVRRGGGLARIADEPGPSRPTSLHAAMGRGARSHCPACGSGRLFLQFLRPVTLCRVCGEDWSHQQADDFPAYIVILIVGHLLAPAIIAVQRAFDPPAWVHMVLWVSIAAGLMIGLLQPAKGAIIAVQWWFGMHGFKDQRDDRSDD